MFIAKVFLLIMAFYVILPRLHSKKNSKRTPEGKKRHAVITGGSSGIGLALAQECIRSGVSKVTLIARNVGNLKKAKAQLETLCQSTHSKTTISILSLDISNAKEVQEKVATFLQSSEPPTLLFNNAGASSSSSFVDTPYEEFDRLMKINYLGGVNVTRAFLPSMIQSYSGGDDSSCSCGASVTFTSSAAGQVGVYGYSAYSPTKAALRGFAESLQMEVRRDNVAVILAYPPDTDTPGYKLEQVGKPLETHLISETMGLFDAKDVSKRMLSAALALHPPFSVYFGLEGWMLATLTAGMSPVHTIIDAICQVYLMGLLRLVSLFYLFDFSRIIQKVGNEKKANKTKKE